MSHWDALCHCMGGSKRLRQWGPSYKDTQEIDPHICGNGHMCNWTVLKLELFLCVYVYMHMLFRAIHGRLTVK